MELFMAQTILILILCGVLAWREYCNAQRLKLLSQKLGAHKRALDGLREHVAKQSEHIGKCAEAFVSIKEYAENSRQFLEKATSDLEFLKHEFELVTAYRKQAMEFDHVEGL